MLRITEEHTPQGKPQLRLEGRLLGLWVTVLRECGTRLEAASLTLDVAGVSYVNDEGVALLLEWQAAGAQIHNCSPFLREVLQQSAAAYAVAPDQHGD